MNKPKKIILHTEKGNRVPLNTQRGTRGEIRSKFMNKWVPIGNNDEKIIFVEFIKDAN